MPWKWRRRGPATSTLCKQQQPEEGAGRAIPRGEDPQPRQTRGYLAWLWKYLALDPGFLGTNTVHCKSLLWSSKFLLLPGTSRDLLVATKTGLAPGDTMTQRPGWNPCCGQPWEEAGRREEGGSGWWRRDGTEDACPARAVLVAAASMLRTSSERLGHLTEAPEGPAFPLPVSCGMANSPEKLRWRQ